MAKKEYQEFIEKLISHDSRKEEDFFMIYGPLTDEYWAQEKKILVCNLETYGYNDWDEDIIVDLNCFYGWMEAKNTRTCHNTALFIYSLETSINTNYPVESLEIKRNYYNLDFLKQSVSKIAYMNLRKISNPTVNQNINEIRKEVNEQLSNLKLQIELLEPSIIILGGWQACTEFNKIFQSNLPKDGKINIGNIQVYSVKHFSRFSYGYFAKKIEEIKQFSFMK